jgi:hypothetical protein
VPRYLVFYGLSHHPLVVLLDLQDYCTQAATTLSAVLRTSVVHERQCFASNRRDLDMEQPQDTRLRVPPTPPFGQRISFAAVDSLRVLARTLGVSNVIVVIVWIVAGVDE